jgi:predicted enzyme related to lactoylglutathione lyase
MHAMQQHLLGALGVGAGRPAAFCWLDLAARAAERARRFYGDAFDWTFDTRHANGGVLTRCHAGDHAIGSLYQLRRAQVAHGMPSHWTPYLRVASVDAGVHRVTDAGGRIVVAPFDVKGMARIALVEDAVGALVGLWQDLAAAQSIGTAVQGGRTRVARDDEPDDVPVRTL